MNKKLMSKKKPSYKAEKQKTKSFSLKNITVD